MLKVISISVKACFIAIINKFPVCFSQNSTDTRIFYPKQTVLPFTLSSVFRESQLAIIYCYLGFKRRYLKILKLLSFRVKLLFERRRGFALSPYNFFLVMLGDFTIKNKKQQDGSRTKRLAS